jgi:hypothetical protein
MFEGGIPLAMSIPESTCTQRSIVKPSIDSLLLSQLASTNKIKKETQGFKFIFNSTIA